MTEFVVEVGAVDREGFSSDGEFDSQTVEISDFVDDSCVWAFIKENKLSPGDKVKITLEKVVE